MSCGAAHHISILVVNLALNDSLSEGAVVFRRRNFALPFRRRVETCARHSQRRKNLLAGEKAERQITLSRQHLAEQDKSDVAVFGTCARRRDKPSGKRRADQFLTRLRELK